MHESKKAFNKESKAGAVLNLLGKTLVNARETREKSYSVSEKLLGPRKEVESTPPDSNAPQSLMDKIYDLTDILNNVIFQTKSTLSEIDKELG